VRTTRHAAAASSWRCLFAITAVLCAVGQARAVTFDEFFKEFREKRGTIETVQARFSQTNVYPDWSEDGWGTIRFASPATLRLEYETDLGEPEVVYHIDGTAVREYDAFVEQVLVLPLDQAPDAEAFILAFANDPSRLRELYDVTLTSTVDSTAEGEVIARNAGLRLEPKAVSDAEKPFDWAHLELRSEDYLPTRIHIQRDAETQVVIDVEDYVINTPIPPRDMAIALPPGTQVIENDEIVETVGNAGGHVPRLHE